MDQIGGQFRERDQHKAAGMKEGVGNGQRWSLYDQIVVKQNVDIDGPRSFCPHPTASQPIFHAETEIQKFEWGEASLRGRNLIEEPWLAYEINGLSFVYGRNAFELNSGYGQLLQSPP